MASAKKVFVVFGATGKQGGSVIDAILADPVASKQFALRGLTRDPNGKSAQPLKAKGVECVAANFDEPPTLSAAFKDAHTIFAVTDYWSTLDSKREFQQGKNIAEAAAAAGAKHLIWSTLLNVSKLTNGKWPNVYHFDAKSEVDDVIRKLGVPATWFLPGFYMANMPGSLIRKDEGSGKFIFNMPAERSTVIPLFDAADDTGKFVKAIALRRDELLDKKVYGATGYYSQDEIIGEFQKAFPEAGKGMDYVQSTEEQFKGAMAKMPKHVQQEMYENFMFMDEFGYYGKADLKDSLALLDAKPTTPAEFFKKSPAFKDLQ